MISREEAVKELALKRTAAKSILDSLPPKTREKSALNDEVEMLTMAIEALSTERPKGHWEVIGKTENGANILQCSNCKRIRRGSVKSAFCRDCGADMREQNFKTAIAKEIGCNPEDIKRIIP